MAAVWHRFCSAAEEVLKMPCGHYMHTYAPRSLPSCHSSLHDTPAVLSLAAVAALTHRLSTAAHFIGLHCILRTVYFAAQRRLFIGDRARVLWRSVGLSVCQRCCGRAAAVAAGSAFCHGSSGTTRARPAASSCRPTTVTERCFDVDCVSQDGLSLRLRHCRPFDSSRAHLSTVALY